jgi:hypothetical protein
MCFTVEKHSLSIKSTRYKGLCLNESACCAGPTRFVCQFVWNPCEHAGHRHGRHAERALMINTARELNPNTETVVRTHNEEEAKLLERERARRIFLGQRKFATRAGARRTGCQ